ncbi:hypothetical protein V8C86DRAFT_2520626 [Haematococcus lacustris]
MMSSRLSRSAPSSCHTSRCTHTGQRPCWMGVPHRCRQVASAASSAFDADLPPPEKEYKPFPRARERNPYRLLGISKDAGFEEVQQARNFLYEDYRWHEPSREAIELAFESILKEKYRVRQKLGFQPPRSGKRGEAVGAGQGVPLTRRLAGLFDATVTLNSFINEAVVYLALGLWALFSSDQSFPLAGAFAYSVYKYQSRRLAASPDGPFFGGNAIVGALLTTTFNIGIACGLMTLATGPLQSVLETSMRQVGAFLVILVAGTLNIYVK